MIATWGEIYGNSQKEELMLQWIRKGIQQKMRVSGVSIPKQTRLVAYTDPRQDEFLRDLQQDLDAQNRVNSCERPSGAAASDIESDGEGGMRN